MRFLSIAGNPLTHLARLNQHRILPHKRGHLSPDPLSALVHDTLGENGRKTEGAENWMVRVRRVVVPDR